MGYDFYAYIKYSKQSSEICRGMGGGEGGKERTSRSLRGTEPIITFLVKILFQHENIYFIRMYICLHSNEGKQQKGGVSAPLES